MARKTPLSWEEHLELGAELKSIRDRLLHIAMEMSNRVGKATKASRTAHAAQRSVDELKCEMDSLVFKAFPEKGFDDLVRVYYGRPEERPNTP